jgi:manganese/zinc/iron transport system substrate-binding protein
MTIAHRVAATASLIVFAVLAAACERSPATANTVSTARVDPGPDGRFEIACTVGMVADIVRQVAGDRATVTNIIGEGVDPHLYKTTRSDVVALEGADIIFYCGLMLEGKMADALVKLARSGKPVYPVTELIDASYLLEPESFAGHADPHVWMDAQGWMKAVEATAQAMSEADPDGTTTYHENAGRYLEELRALDAYARECIASIPESSRLLVTAHDAFNYFGRAYAIEVLGIQGISTESEAGLDDINTLVDTIVRRDVKAVFVETSVADENVRALVEGAAARGHELRIGGALFSDAMGTPGTYEGTYVGMIDHNATTIARALGGDAPAHGMHGWLGGKRSEP